MYWVPSDPECLSHPEELDVFQLGLGLLEVLVLGVDQQIGAELIAAGLLPEFPIEA